MAHGKETPRQKMIGMMYLVLMAMLALNVAREVLDAFVLIDESLMKTTENFTAKNEDAYFAFEQAAAESPEKAKPWLDKALEVKRRADELYERIQELKIEIIQTAEGEDTEVVHDGEIDHSHEIGMMDDNMVPAEIMIGAARDGAGFALKGEMEGFREYLLSLVSEEAVTTRESILKSLNTDDPPPDQEHTGELPLTWEDHHFAHLPLIAVISLMSKLQSDVRNAESDAIRYLYGQIEAGTFKFNKIDPVVIANSDNITRGAEYRAEVFLAAFDTTQKPIVYIGEYDSTINEETGMVEYSMKGTLGQDYDSIPVSGGKGIYTVQATSTGPKKWGGIISLKRLDGSYSSRPFTSDYQVSPPSLVVSPTKMNVFYLGVDNPVEISVPGYPANTIRPSMTNGTIRGSSGNYIVNPTREGNASVSVSVEVDGSRRSMGSRPFRVRPVPDPYPTLAGARGGTVNKSDVLRELGPEASMPDWFEFDLTFEIVSFTVGAQFQGLFRREFSSSGSFTSNQREILRQSQSGSIIYITDIKAVGPDGTTREIGAMTIQYR